VTSLQAHYILCIKEWKVAQTPKPPDVNHEHNTAIEHGTFALSQTCGFCWLRSNCHCKADDDDDIMFYSLEWK